MILPRGLGLAGYEYLGESDEGGRQQIELRYAPGERPRCVRCGCGMRSLGWRVRRPEHLPLGLVPCRLVVRFQRWRCAGCGTVRAPQLPGLKARARISEQLRRFIAALLGIVPASLAALGRWLRLGWGTVWRAVAGFAGGGVGPAGSRHLALDEVYFRRGQYLTVLRDDERGCVLSTALGRGYAAARAVLLSLPAEVRGQVRTLSCDFWRAYRRAACELLPKARVVADCFHLVRSAAREARRTPPAARPAHWQAWRELRHLLRQRGQQACDCLAAWMTRLERQGQLLSSTMRTMRDWQPEIEAYLLTGRSNGRTEALNSNIALLRHLARGYHNPHNFTARIMSLNPALHH